MAFETDALGQLEPGYWQWAKAEGVPIHVGHGFGDVAALPVAPWPRMGGNGAIIRMHGAQGLTGLYLAEIPPRASLNPEKHLYEEIVCVLTGYGSAEVWQGNGPKRTFEWGPGSVFSPPLNCWHQLHNGSSEPVRFLVLTNAPLVMDNFHNPDFIFNCDYEFKDRFDGRADYFEVTDKRYPRGMQNLWETNFIADLLKAKIEPRPQKGAGVLITQFEMAGNTLVGHMSAWPGARYHKAHHHGPGAVLLGLRGEGYVLMWPKEAGARPYENGMENEIVRIDWKPGSIYSPPGGWFHQHFNTTAEPALHLALRFGSRLHRVGHRDAFMRDDDAVFRSVRDGGNLIEFDDEDPRIRRDFEDVLRANGVESQMPPVEYRSDAPTV